MLKIVKISGNSGSGKSQLLAMIAARSLGRNYLMVTGDSTPDGIAQALRGRRDVVLCIDDCPASLLEALPKHPELGRGDRVTQVYAVVEEPQVNGELLKALELVNDCLVKCLTGGEVSAKLAGKAIEQAATLIEQAKAAKS